MKIKWKLLYLLLALPVIMNAQTEKVDPTAVLILDHMSDVIGELSSCSYNLVTSVDLTSNEYGLEKQFSTHEVHIVGPNKMLVQTWGRHGHEGYWYDGDSLTYYSYKENNFSKIPAPSTVLATIDSINATFDIEIPAADFFYPTFTDDILDNFGTIALLGNKVIEGRNCVHILANNENLNVQLWIANDGTNLPVKLVIIYKDQNPATQYEATFMDWQINPDLPLSMFNFAIPADARRIRLVPKL